MRPEDPDEGVPAVESARFRQGEIRQEGQWLALEVEVHAIAQDLRWAQEGEVDHGRRF